MLSIHLERILKWRNSPTVREKMYTQRIISLEEHLAWWKGISKKDDVKYFICEFEEMPVGVVSFININLYAGHASWAFYTDPNANKKTAAWLELLALDYAFSDLGLRKLNCEVLSFNKSVINMHKKYGFKVEGRLIQQFRGTKGYSDIEVLAIFKKDWLESRPRIMNQLNRIG